MGKGAVTPGRVTTGAASEHRPLLHCWFDWQREQAFPDSMIDLPKQLFMLIIKLRKNTEK